MNEPEPNRRDDIIDAALRVFSTHGFHKATIKQIANEAGLKSPSLIYWYFKDKKEVLQAVFSRLVPLINEVGNPAAVAQIIEQPPEVVLLMFAKMFLNIFKHPDAGRLFRIFISEAVRSTEFIDQVAESGPVIMLGFLTAYLQHQIELGRLRPHNPHSSVRSFMGMLIVYIFGRELVPPLGAGLPAPEQYAPEVVAIFLDGLRAT